MRKKFTCRGGQGGTTVMSWCGSGIGAICPERHRHYEHVFPPHPANTFPERLPPVVTCDDEDVALANALLPQRHQAALDQGSTDATAAVGGRDKQVMQVAAPPVV